MHKLKQLSHQLSQLFHHVLQVESSSAEAARARATLEEVRTGGKHTTQRQLDAVQAELREATASVETARVAHDQVRDDLHSD